MKRARFWPPRDRENRVIPHQLETAGILKALPGLLGFFERRVPPEFWIEADLGAGSMQITIACRCGAEPVLTFGLRSYSIEECRCGRFFMYAGGEVRVGYDVEKLEPDPEAPEPEEPEVEPPAPPDS